MPHISYSELKDWAFCPFYHKLTRVDGIDGFKGNAYTAFGTALHEACEKLTLNNSSDYEKIFNRELKGKIQDFYDALGWGIIPENNLIFEFFEF